VVWKSLQPSGEVPKLVTLAGTRRAESYPANRERMALTRFVADVAVGALIVEATLTPKPGLVDKRGPGAHGDMNLEMLVRSAHSLRSTFAGIASAAFQTQEDRALRETLSKLGRDGERVMLQTTNGVNTHRGSIWTLGLLCAGAAMITEGERSARAVCAKAARVARLKDSFRLPGQSHGQRALSDYGARGARGEAEDEFPHLLHIGLPMLRRSISHGLSTEHARLNALIAIMAVLDDTCLLHRGGLPVLTAAKCGARKILDCGGASTREGSKALLELDQTLLRLNASPGGSADLLAAVVFLNFVENAVNSQEARHGNHTL
jgi:triphosphoribosyl-dephospho-CoA synthase